MGITDSKRYREALLAAVDDDGLEKLVKELVVPNYPEAYLTGPGQDAGVDVLSDLDDPPNRAWQAKNYSKAGINWSACRDSLAAAMEGPKPRHYTFVFPRKLRKGELKYWREKFQPTELAKYEKLDQLDFEVDLAEQLRGRPELVDDMSDGALSEYLKPILRQLADPDGRQPGTTTAHENLGEKAAQEARLAGKTDSRFAYGVAGREAGARDSDLPERTARFTMSHRLGELPSYSLSLRKGDSVIELSAQPRQGVEVESPEVWFAPTEVGKEALMQARNSLAKGKPIEFASEDVAVRPKEVPEQFRDRLDHKGLLRGGTVELGLSEIVPLNILLTDKGQDLPQLIDLYRVPPLHEGAEAYGGSLGGCCVFLDIIHTDTVQTNPGERAFELELSLTLAVAGEKARDALHGLGFARAFTSAEQLRFECPDLLPEEGIEIGAKDGSVENEATWEAAAIVAGALAALEDRDDRERQMPESVTEGDRYAAQLTYRVLRDESVEGKVEGQFWLPAKAVEVEGRASDELTRMVVELPPIAGESSGIMVEREMKGVEVVDIVPWKEGWVRMLFRSNDGGWVLVREVDEAKG